MLSVDWAPHPDEGDKVLFIFDGGRLHQDDLTRIRFTDNEIVEYEFVARGELEQFTIPRLTRRIRATLDAVVSQCPGAYLEDGMTPS